MTDYDVLKNVGISVAMGNAIENVKEELDLEVCYKVAVIDVTKCRMYLKNFGEFYKNQIESASTVIFSRTDIAKFEKVSLEQYLTDMKKYFEKHNAKNQNLRKEKRAEESALFRAYLPSFASRAAFWAS